MKISIFYLIEHISEDYQNGYFDDGDYNVLRIADPDYIYKNIYAKLIYTGADGRDCNEADLIVM